MEEGQVKSLKRIAKNLDKGVNSLVINRNCVNQIIEDLKKSLENLLSEIKKEKELSRQTLSFEFEKFFEECEKRIQKIKDEIKRNQDIMGGLTSELKEKFSEQKKYENLLKKAETKLRKRDKLNEQKQLDELVQQRNFVTKVKG